MIWLFSSPMPLLNITILINKTIAAIATHGKFLTVLLWVTTEFYPINECILNECATIANYGLESTYPLPTIGYPVNPCFPPSTPRADETQSAKSLVPILQQNRVVQGFYLFLEWPHTQSSLNPGSFSRLEIEMA